MSKSLPKPLARGLRAALVTVPLLLAACGGDGDDDTSSGTSAPSEAGTASDDSVPDGTEASGDGAPPAASNAFCDIVPAEEVAAAAGIDVSSTTPGSGTGSYQEIDYSTIGCTYEAADGGDVSINGLTDETGTQLPKDVFDDLKAASEASSFDDFPHEAVAGLGNGAFFLASLGPSDSLIVDTSPSPILVIRNHRELPLSRDALQAVAEVAVQAYN